MPLQKIQFKPGIVRDLTAYTTEGGWFDGNLVRFRLGFPQSVGGWERFSVNTFLGVCRSIMGWSTLAGQYYMGIGTSLKFYIENAQFIQKPLEERGLMDLFKNVKTYIYTRPDSMGPGYNYHWLTQHNLCSGCFSTYCRTVCDLQ